jgi:hypothetical protein
MLIWHFSLLLIFSFRLVGGIICGSGIFSLKLNSSSGWRRIKFFLTWDILQKKGWEGPSMCVLCKRSTEDINHLFIDCLFTKKVWNRIKTIQNHKRIWEGKTLSECFYIWIKDKSVSPTLATIICWCIWTERNMAIFESAVPSINRCLLRFWHFTSNNLRLKFASPSENVWSLISRIFLSLFLMVLLRVIGKSVEQGGLLKPLIPCL